MATSFNRIYTRFYSKLTDDMYMELDKAQTDALVQELMINALDWFEFPRVNIYSYDTKKASFNANLTAEEINIIATYMVVCWLDQQLANIEQIRQKFSGSDFKFTSQANHLAKILALKQDYERVGFHLQRLYKRRKADADGVMKSTFGNIMATSVRAGNVGSISTGGVEDRPDYDDDDDDDNGGGENWEDMEDLPPEIPPENESWEDMEDL